MKSLAAALAVLAISGCRFIPSPYDHAECWLMREDALLAFSVPADIFYVQDKLCTDEANISLMSSYVHSEVGKGRFAGLARVFAPLIANEEDLDRAISWYFWHAHDGNKPFFLIGEGEGGKLLQAYEIQHAGELRKMGFAASFYTETGYKGFVNAETVAKVKDMLAKIKYKSIWGREMPGSKSLGSDGPDGKAPAAEAAGGNESNDSHAY